jgi:hypothetical protein
MKPGKNRSCKGNLSYFPTPASISLKFSKPYMQCFPLLHFFFFPFWWIVLSRVVFIEEIEAPEK